MGIAWYWLHSVGRCDGLPQGRQQRCRNVRCLRYRHRGDLIMPGVRVLIDFGWAIQAVNGTGAVNYIADIGELVTTPCAEAAFAAGAAVPWEPVNNDPPPPYEEAPQPPPTVDGLPP